MKRWTATPPPTRARRLGLAAGLLLTSLLVSPRARAGAPAYDLVLQHGRVLDPGSGRDAVLDVAIVGGRIARIAPTIETEHATTVIDATGLLITPGLVDLHTHVFFGPDAQRYLSNSPLAAQPDDFAPRGCTTTVVDAGSAGHRTFAQLQQQIIAPARTRVLAFLNIVGGGMAGRGTEQDLGDMDAQATADAIKQHPGVIVGVKVAHYAGPGWEPIVRAEEATRLAGGRVMVDFGEHQPPLSLEDLLLHKLRPGDIYTHVFADVPGRTPVVDARGVVRPYVWKAHERGIFFDLGYGGASFSYGQAAPALKQGFWPDALGTDAHRASLRGSMHDLPAVISRLDALGMPLPELIRRATATPADLVGRPDLGRLAEGGEADVAVLRVETGRFSFPDVKGARVEGPRQLTCAVTVRAGQVLWDPDGRARKR